MILLVLIYKTIVSNYFYKNKKDNRNYVCQLSFLNILFAPFRSSSSRKWGRIIFLSNLRSFRGYFEKWNNRHKNNKIDFHLLWDEKYNNGTYHLKWLVADCHVKTSGCRSQLQPAAALRCSALLLYTPNSLCLSSGNTW